MRRPVVSLLMLALCLSVPVAAEAGQKKGNRVSPRKAKPNRVKMQPRRGQGIHHSVSLGAVASRRAPAQRQVQELEPAYDDQGFDDQGFDDQGFDDQGFDDQGFDDQGFDDAQHHRAPAVQLGWAQGRRTHYRSDGSMRPVAPGYGSFEPFVGGKSKALSTAGKVVVTGLTIGIVVVAGLAIGVPLLHNLPQLLGGR